MATVLFQFFAAAAVIIVAGSFLARFADRIAEVTGLGRLVIGSILLAGATSMPELSVDLAAVRTGLPDLAVGDLLGSSLMNLLILAVLDASWYSAGRMLSRSAAGHALSGSMSIALTAVVGMGLVSAGRYSDPGWLGLSFPTWAIVIGYGLGVRVVFLDQRLSAATAAERQKESGERPAEPGGLTRPLVGFLIATAVLFVAGPRLTHAADQLAELTGLGKSFVGTTLVAFSTSLPELVASMAAVRMRSFDLVIGNVFGSNTFNMVLFVVLDLFQPGPLFEQVSPVHVVSCFATIAATSVAVMGQLYQVERRRKLVEPDAWLMILLILGALGALYGLSG